MLYLASRSPRRNELLARLDIPFRALDLEVPECRGADESPLAYVRRVALDKARAGLAQVVGDPQPVVLGSDTEVVLGDRVYGKPVDAADAAAMLRSLAGRTHRVITAVALAAPAREAQVVVESEVTFAAMAEDEIAAYVASGEPMGKAGAYAIQGGAERWISRLAGSYSGVMGLPLQQTAALLRGFGVTGKD
ncbi:septum formation inhibitor Maf [Stenotrophomonas acidaminiphila]|uniref:Maf family nucleotide pyrophosphatase n=1 Tax=Stenotrophomonas TaxID=40323 RepID=UPI001353A57C|nr:MULTISPECIES: Maf family nucleotide pyrophosphatase [Stenotrophomonas]MTI72883.1 septum formation inhibitor Maf [Stenotrophomonas sp.]NCT86490.1 septum formation inhibitor Maf [Stenotrophomonas acidaminiphila]WPU54873.1 Maf family nucleotide pyrophosphatase [Stenotrophomonas acidaminiphila]